MTVKDYILKTFKGKVTVDAFDTGSTYYHIDESFLVRLSDHCGVNNNFDMSILCFKNDNKHYAVFLGGTRQPLLMDYHEVTSMIYSLYWAHKCGSYDKKTFERDYKDKVRALKSVEKNLGEATERLKQIRAASGETASTDWKDSIHRIDRFDELYNMMVAELPTIKTIGTIGKGSLRKLLTASPVIPYAFIMENLNTFVKVDCKSKFVSGSRFQSFCDKLIKRFGSIG